MGTRAFIVTLLFSLTMIMIFVNVAEISTHLLANCSSSFLSRIIVRAFFRSLLAERDLRLINLTLYTETAVSLNMV